MIKFFRYREGASGVQKELRINNLHEFKQNPITAAIADYAEFTEQTNKQNTGYLFLYVGLPLKNKYSRDSGHSTPCVGNLNYFAMFPKLPVYKIYCEEYHQSYCGCNLYNEYSDTCFSEVLKCWGPDKLRQSIASSTKFTPFRCCDCPFHDDWMKSGVPVENQLPDDYLMALKKHSGECEPKGKTIRFKIDGAAIGFRFSPSRKL